MQESVISCKVRIFLQNIDELSKSNFDFSLSLLYLDPLRDLFGGLLYRGDDSFGTRGADTVQPQAYG